MDDFFTDKIRSESIRLTQVKYKPAYEPICITEWSSNGLPDWGSRIDLTLKTEDKALYLEGKDFLSDVLYSGKQFIPNHQKYMVLEIEDGEARLKPCAYFRMKPQINLPNRKSNNLSSLSIKEQMDEYNEKFGLKRTIKRLAEKKKFAIAFGEEDFDDMKTKAASMDIKSSKDEATKTKADATDILNDSFLMPSRNPNATSAKEVYNIDDIVPENIVTSVQSSYNLEDLSKYLNSPLVKNFALHAKDNQEKVCCIFLDALIKLKSLRASALKKVESHGLLELQSSELEQHILDNYTVSLHENRKSVRTMTEKCKDKIIIHGLILSIYLNHFKSLLISEVSKVFVTPAIKMRKLGNIVGCHVDVNKAKTDKVFLFRLPLHTMDDNTYKRRRAK